MKHWDYKLLLGLVSYCGIPFPVTMAIEYKPKVSQNYICSCIFQNPVNLFCTNKIKYARVFKLI